MLSAEERYQLLETATALSEEWNPQGVDELLSPLAEEDLRQEPELGHFHAIALYRTGRLREAFALVEKLTDVAQRHSPNLACRHLLLRGALLVDKGDLAGGEELFTHASVIADAHGDQNQLALARMNMGVIALIRCDWMAGLASFSRAEAAYMRLGQTMDVAFCAHNRGMAYRELGRLAVAADAYEIAIGHYLDNGNFRNLAPTETERALLYRELRDRNLAEAAVRRALNIARFFNNLRQEAEAVRVMGMLKLDEGALEEAKVHFDRALTLAQHTNAAMLEAEVFEELAVLARSGGHVEHSRRRASRAAVLYSRLGAAKRTERMYARLGD